MSRAGFLFVLCSACGFTVGAGTPTDGPIDVPPDIIIPPDAPGCAPAEIVAGGEHTCARTIDGDVYCWGRGANGELGVTPLQYRCAVGGTMYYCSPAPRRVELTGAVSLGLGNLHTCATTANGTSCWGVNLYGGYGDGTTYGQMIPRMIPQRAGATVIEGGVNHTCSIASGSVSCSGQNAAGEIGNNTMVTATTAVAVMPNATALGVGDYTTCAIDDQQRVVCWGRNFHTQIDSTQANKLTPTVVANMTNATQVVAGRDHVCAAFGDRTARCWGSNAQGQLGNGATATTPQAPVVIGVPDVVQLAAERHHTCAIDGAGDVWCFGEAYTPTPTKVPLGRPAIAITAGTFHDCAITSDATAWCWGNQDFGQLGDGVNSSTRAETPQQVPFCP